MYIVTGITTLPAQLACPMSKEPHIFQMKVSQTLKQCLEHWDAYVAWVREDSTAGWLVLGEIWTVTRNEVTRGLPVGSENNVSRRLPRGSLFLTWRPQLCLIGRRALRVLLTHCESSNVEH